MIPFPSCRGRHTYAASASWLDIPARSDKEGRKNQGTPQKRIILGLKNSMKILKLGSKYMVSKSPKTKSRQE
ncbi:hypothetical protein J6590_029562 [Homalodisca vitripennis]|nr:hypothetical protein J6590_029562 [Homalodisca vitripennis]